MNRHSICVICSWYFFYFGSEGCIYPFINVLLFDRGMTPDQIGLIGLIRPWSGMLAAPLWSILADWFKIHRPLMILLLIVANLIRMSLFKLSNSFLSSLFIIAAVEIVGAPVNVVADSAVTKKCTRDGEYGKYRLWGAVGWGIMGSIVGLAMDRWGIGIGFLLSLILAIPTALLSWVLLSPADLSSEDLSIEKIGLLSELSMTEIKPAMILDRPYSNKKDQSLNKTPSLKLPAADSELPQSNVSIPHHHIDDGSFSQKLLLVLSSTEIRIFLLTSTVMGFGYGCIEGYLFLLLRSLGANDLLLGLTMTIACLAEVPIFLIQGPMIRKLGCAALLDLCCATYVLRMFFYAALPFLSTPFFVLPIELLHGMTFALGWGAGTEMVKRLSPPGLETTVQGLFHSAYYGLGYSLGILTGGLILTRYSYTVLFLIGSCVVLIGSLISRLLRWALVERKVESERPGVQYTPVSNLSI